MVNGQDYLNYKLQTLVFDSGRRRFGVPLIYVQEVRKCSSVFYLPEAPQFVEGIVYLHKNKIPIINFVKYFGLEGADSENSWSIQYLVLVEVDGRLMGISADESVEIIDIPFSQIDFWPYLYAEINEAFLLGICNLKGQKIIILNPNALRQIDEELVLFKTRKKN